MTRLSVLLGLALSIQAALVTSTTISAGGLGFNFPNDDTFNAIANCCEFGCDQACSWVDQSLGEGLARHRKTQTNFDPSRVDFDQQLPPVGPDADLNVVNANCCCRDGGCFGDPHFKLWNSEQYDFNGQCSLVLLDAPDAFNNLGVTVHLRTKLQATYSFIESAAVKIGDDILEVSSWSEYSLNGVDGAAMPNHLGPFPVTRSEVFRSKKDSTFEIDLGQGQQIVVKTRKDWVTVKMIKMKQRGFKNSRGMMGDFTTGAMLARDGKTVLKDPNAFGQEWQVRQDDPQLFGTVLSPQYPEQCIMPSLPSSTGRRLGESSVSEDEAKLACGSLHGQSYANCVFDVVHSGDLEIAEFYEQF